MRVIYCYRCKSDVPGLDDAEDAELRALWKSCCEMEREHTGDLNAWKVIGVARTSPNFAPVRDRYRQITGQDMATKCMDFFHRLSAMGSPCPNCGVALRTPKAQICLACGWNGRTSN
jgi:hypothetical protein